MAMMLMMNKKTKNTSLIWIWEGGKKGKMERGKGGRESPFCVCFITNIACLDARCDASYYLLTIVPPTLTARNQPQTP